MQQNHSMIPRSAPTKNGRGVVSTLFNELLLLAVRNKFHRKEIEGMATNTGKDHRVGAVRDRSQTYNPKTDSYVKRDSDTGKFIDQKADSKPFKGVTKEAPKK